MRPNTMFSLTTMLPLVSTTLPLVSNKIERKGLRASFQPAWLLSRASGTLARAMVSQCFLGQASSAQEVAAAHLVGRSIDGDSRQGHQGPLLFPHGAPAA